VLKLEINRLEAHIDLLCENAENEDNFKKYCMTKLEESGFDLSKDIEYADEIHTITFTQEE